MAKSVRARGVRNVRELRARSPSRVAPAERRRSASASTSRSCAPKRATKRRKSVGGLNALQPRIAKVGRCRSNASALCVRSPKRPRPTRCLPALRRENARRVHRATALRAASASASIGPPETVRLGRRGNAAKAAPRVASESGSDRPSGDRPARPPREHSEGRAEGGTNESGSSVLPEIVPHARQGNAPKAAPKAAGESGLERLPGDLVPHGRQGNAVKGRAARRRAQTLRAPRRETVRLDRRESASEGRTEGGERKRFEPSRRAIVPPVRQESAAKAVLGRWRRAQTIRASHRRPSSAAAEGAHRRTFREGGERKRFERPAGDRPARPPRETQRDPSRRRRSQALRQTRGRPATPQRSAYGRPSAFQGRPA